MEGSEGMKIIVSIQSPMAQLSGSNDGMVNVTYWRIKLGHLVILTTQLTQHDHALNRCFLWLSLHPKLIVMRVILVSELGYGVYKGISLVKPEIKPYEKSQYSWLLLPVEPSVVGHAHGES